nr:integrase, catalytic region, zinc finger, CCHC-type, peptidase aspartic, catalytic [Tanacetum cinerariifolium]
MNYLEEQTDEEAMINSIKNGDQPLPRVTQVSIAGTSSTEQSPLKDKSMCNKTAKDLWDALTRHMLGSEYGEQDRKAAVFYEYKTFKATEEEFLLDTYIRYLQKKTIVVTSDPLALIVEKTKVIKRKEKVVVSSDSEGSDADDFSELKKITALLAKAFNQRKFYSKPTNNNLRTSSTSQSANTKQEFVLSDSETSSSSTDDKISEVSYYLSEYESESEYETSEYYDNTTTYGLFVNDNDDQEIFHDCENFPENLIESQIDHNESDIDHNDSEGIDKLIRKFNKKIAKCLKRIEKANQQNKDFKNQNKDLQDKYDVLKNQATTFEMNNKELNELLKVLIEKNDDLLAQTKVLKDQLQVKHVVIDTHIADQEVLYDKMSVQLVELDKHVRDLKNTVLEKDFKISKLEECVRNKDLKIEKCLKRLNVCENKLHKMGQINQTVHMIMPSKDTLYNGRKGIGFENPSYFEKAKDLRPSLYDEKVIGLGYTPMFLTYSDEALEIKKFKRARENKIEFAYDYGDLNASYVNEKINFSDDYFQEIINPNFEKIDSLFQQTSSLKPLCDSFDENNLFIFDDEGVRISPDSKMTFRKKPRDSMNGCSKHMTGNCALLTNFVEKFLGTIRFGNNDFAMIAGYGDVVIGSMTIKKVYYVEVLGHNLFSVGQFCDKGLEVAFRKSACFVRNEDGVDSLTGDRSSNLYTIALNEVA